MKEELFYKIFDVACTMIEAVYIVLLMLTFTNQKFRSKKNIVVGICFLIFTVAGTYLILQVYLKALLLTVGFGILWSLVKKSSLLESIALSGLTFGVFACLQGVAIFIESFFLGSFSFHIGKIYIQTWQYTLLMQIFCMSAVFIIYKVLRDLHFRWRSKDLILVGLIGYTEVSMFGFFLGKLLQGGKEERGALFFAIFLFCITFLLIIHFQQTGELRETEEREKQRLHDLEMKVSYYQEKTAQEQKVRKLYHDIKNLIMAVRLSKEETPLLDTVEQELQEYDQYYETGNIILNVILKEKIKSAQENGIDVKLDVDFSDAGLIEDRDIVTIFGNALDNAIEACEKIPEEERLITVKAGTIRNMLSIIFENSMAVEAKSDLHSTKPDTFMHGFGLENIRESVERYDGINIIEAKNGRFLLKILIPIL